jgi:hypothetical protein
MSSATQFQTIHDVIAVMSPNMPHALVQDAWSRLERVIRIFGRLYGADPRDRISKIIDKHLPQHPVMTPAIIGELHRMRGMRNLCAHGDAPSLSVEESSAYAYRAWDIQSALAWNNAEFLSKPSGARRTDVPVAGKTHATDSDG